MASSIPARLIGVLIAALATACGSGASPSKGENTLLRVSGAQFAEGALPAPGVGPTVTAIETMDAPGTTSLALAIIVAASILAAETYGALRLLGRAFAKAEPGS